MRITEVDEQGEAVAEDESNVHMQAAEMQLMAPREVEEDFNRMLSKLVGSPLIPELPFTISQAPESMTNMHRASPLHSSCQNLREEMSARSLLETQIGLKKLEIDLKDWKNLRCCCSCTIERCRVPA